MNPRSLAIAPLLLVLASAPVAMAQTKNANPANQKSTVATAASSTNADAKPIEDLQLAAQRLRDAIHDMLRQPAGLKRAESIEAGDKALAKVESAMVNLPPELLIAQANESTYKKTEDQLQRAVQNLQEATQALAKDPNSKRRNETIKKIKTALQETHRLMREIPRGSKGA